MIEPGLATIIIPVFNRPDMLKDAVASALAQTYRPIEVLIIDDGSSDETQQVAQELAANNHEISAYRIENSGPGLAREHGRLRAKGEFIQYLDSDDLISPSKLKRQIDQLSVQMDCDVSYCRQEYCDFNGEVLNPAWMRSGEVFESMFPAMLGGRIWGTPVPLYRSSLLERAGPWLDLKNQEDWEYDCRIASFGVKLAYVNETLVTIRTHQESHYGLISSNQLNKLSDCSKAYKEIFSHAMNANIDLENPEFQKFNRSVFLLARQCADRGLSKEARLLMDIAKMSALTLKRKFEYSLYTNLSSVFGWKTLGRLSAFFDRIRT